MVFRTGQLGDFEYLVRLLKAKPVDPRVGTRDMDVRKPGLNIPGIMDPALGGILKLGGALRVPLISYTPEQLAEVLSSNTGRNHTRSSSSAPSRRSSILPTTIPPLQRRMRTRAPALRFRSIEMKIR